MEPNNEIGALEEMEAKIKELESEKAGLIKQIQRLNERLKYKKLELQALQPFLEQTKDANPGPLKRKLRALEFRISTQALTPTIERNLVRKVKEIEEKLKEFKPIEQARRKKKYLEGDIEEIEGKIKEIEEKLNSIRAELKDLYKERKRKKSVGDHTVTLADVAIIEKSDK